MPKKTHSLVARIGEDGTFDWCHPRTARSVLGNFGPGDHLSVTLRKAGKAKSNEQMGIYYASLLPAIHQTLVEDGHEVCGVPITLDMTDQIVKHYCAEGKLKRNMTRAECSEFIDNVMRWGQQALSIEHWPHEAERSLEHATL